MGPALLGRPDDRLRDDAIHLCRKRKDGLLRRFAPRNDEGDYRPLSARIFSAARRCGLSSILPSILTTPDGLPAKAATTRRDHAISSSVGLNAALTMATCLGWIPAFARKPSCRAAIASAFSASRSSMSVAIVSIATTPAAAPAIRQRPRASTNGEW